MIGRFLLAGYGFLVALSTAYLLFFLRASLRQGCGRTGTYALRAEDRVSMVIPVANEEGLLSLCLDSVLRQDLSHVDSVIVAINGSLDRTERIVDGYAKRHPIIVKVVLPHPGRVKALLAAMRRAVSRHIWVMDADIDLAPGAVSRLLRFHFGSGNYISTCLIDPLTQDALIPRLISCDRLFRVKILKLARNAWRMANVPGNLFVVDKKLYWRLMAKDALLDDNELTYRLWREGKGISFLPEVLACERERLTLRNLVGQRKRWVLGNLETFPAYVKSLSALPLGRLFIAISYPLLWYILHYALALGSVAAFLGGAGWRAAYFTLAGAYGLCVAASLRMRTTEHTRAFTAMDAVAHCLIFPWAVTAATVLALAHLLRDTQAVFCPKRNKTSFVRDAPLPAGRIKRYVASKDAEKAER